VICPQGIAFFMIIRPDQEKNKNTTLASFAPCMFKVKTKWLSFFGKTIIMSDEKDRALGFELVAKFLP